MSYDQHFINLLFQIQLNILFTSINSDDFYLLKHIAEIGQLLYNIKSITPDEKN